jgi:hypothetical protein
LPAEVHLTALASGEEPGAAGRLDVPDDLHQLSQLPAQGLQFVLQREDAADALQVDALGLGELLDVAQLIAAAGAARPARDDEAEPVVAAERLGVHLGELRCHRDHEDGGVGIDPRRQSLGHGRGWNRSARGSAPAASAA